MLINVLYSLLLRPPPAPTVVMALENQPLCIRAQMASINKELDESPNAWEEESGDQRIPLAGPASVAELQGREEEGRSLAPCLLEPQSKD